MASEVAKGKNRLHKLGHHSMGFEISQTKLMAFCTKKNLCKLQSFRETKSISSLWFQTNLFDRFRCLNKVKIQIKQ